MWLVAHTQIQQLLKLLFRVGFIISATFQ